MVGLHVRRRGHMHGVRESAWKAMMFLLVTTTIVLVQILCVGVELCRGQEDPRFTAGKRIYRS